MKEALKNLFRKRTALELASQELADAERSLLEAQTAVEYSRAIVTYNTERIARLRSFVRSNTGQ